MKEEKDLEALPSIFRPPGQDNSHSFPRIKQKTWQTRKRILNIQEWWSVKNGRPSFLRFLTVVQLVEKFDCIELKRAGIANSLWEGRLQNRASIPGRGKRFISSPQFQDGLFFQVRHPHCVEYAKI